MIQPRKKSKPQIRWSLGRVRSFLPLVARPHGQEDDALTILSLLLREPQGKKENTKPNPPFPGLPEMQDSVWDSVRSITYSKISGTAGKTKKKPWISFFSWYMYTMKYYSTLKKWSLTHLEELKFQKWYINGKGKRNSWLSYGSENICPLLTVLF